MVVSTSKNYYTGLVNIEEENKKRKAKAILGYKELYERFHSEGSVSQETLERDLAWQNALNPNVLETQATNLDIKDLYNLKEQELAATPRFLELSKFFFQEIKVAPIQLSWQTEADEDRDFITLAACHENSPFATRRKESGKRWYRP